jgi:8-oxo-dGTP pyrophosphatase MutT (NUDIX family)/phosphoserine phosphatase
MHYLIFDFDGVLGDTLEPLVKINAKVDGTAQEQARNKILSHYENKTPHGKEKSIEEIQKWAKFYEILGKELHQEGYNLFEGFIEEIAKISDVRLAIVSSANTIHTKSIVNQTGLDFTHVLGFQDHHSKEEKVKIIAKDWGVDLNELYYFTDTKTDFWELEDLLDKTKIIGCTWGWQGYDKLREVLPTNQILKEFADIHLVLPPVLDDLKEGSEYFKNLGSWSKRDNRDIVIGGFIKNQEGKILVQKRSPTRRLFPNCWDLSFGGHVEIGESIYEAIKRELFEETGLELDAILDIILIYDWSLELESQKAGENPLRREFDFIISVKGDLENIKIEEGKVSEIRWIDQSEIEILKDGNNGDYIYNLARKVLE